MSSVAVTPERIKVVLATAGRDAREVQIVMSPDDWSCLWGTAMGDFDSAVTYVRSVLEGLSREHSFLVYDRYELHPSTTPNLPEDPEDARLREMLLQHPDGIKGRWVAYTGDGVAHPFPEPPPNG